MKRRNFIGSASLLAVPRLISADDGEPQIFQESHMGTMWTLKLFAPDEEIGRRAAADAFKRLAALDARLSDYRMDSELSQLSATAGSGKPRAVSRDLLTVLLLSQKAAAESGGLFDITLGACVQLWRESKKTRHLPSPVALAVARAASGWKSLEIDESTATVLLRIPGTRLDLGGIAKGWAADEMLHLLKTTHGIQAALIDASGGVSAIGRPKNGRPWRVGIQKIRENEATTIISLSDASVATSGDLFQHIEIDGTRYSHIIDPATGLGMQQISQASVTADTGALTDWMATTLCLMGPKRGLDFAERYAPSVEARIATSDKTVITKNFGA